MAADESCRYWESVSGTRSGEDDEGLNTDCWTGKNGGGREEGRGGEGSEDTDLSYI